MKYQKTVPPTQHMWTFDNQAMSTPHTYLIRVRVTEGAPEMAIERLNRDPRNEYVLPLNVAELDQLIRALSEARRILDVGPAPKRRIKDNPQA